MTRCRTELADFKTFGIDLRVSISALRLPKPLDLYIQRAPRQVRSRALPIRSASFARLSEAHDAKRSVDLKA